jgi:hypothetical protein
MSGPPVPAARGLQAVFAGLIYPGDIDEGYLTRVKRNLPARIAKNSPSEEFKESNSFAAFPLPGLRPPQQDRTVLRRTRSQARPARSCL